MQVWFHFCEKKVASIEKTWNRKLENPDVDPDPVEDDSNKNGEGDDHEDVINDMFKNLEKKNLFNRVAPGRNIRAAPTSAMDDFLRDRDNEAEDEEERKKKEVAEKAKAFHEEPKTGQYGDNQFWRAPDLYDIDDLMAELDSP